MTISKRVKQVYLSSLLAVILFCFHNFMNLMYGGREWVSFVFMALAILLSAIAVIYATMEFAITKEPEDLWKIGFLGILGLAGLIPGLGIGFFGFFGLFAFFGTRQYF